MIDIKKNRIVEYRAKFMVRCLLCALLLTLVGPSKGMGITIKEEEELSRQLMQVVFMQFPLIKDSVVVDYINDVGKRILAVIPTPPFAYHFYVLKEDVYNAFATPAGHIFINSGLFAAMENEEELAGILGHEISHVSARHISQKIERQKKAQLTTVAGMLAGALLGVGGAGTAANAVTMGSMAAGQSMMLAYSREDEMQADQMGLGYLDKAGYSGNGLITMLVKIRGKDWFGSEIPTYLKTHPASEERILYLDNRLSQNPRPDKKGDEYGFRRAHTFLVANYQDKETAYRLFEKAVNDRPKDPMAHYGFGLVLARNGNRKAAVNHLKASLEGNAFDPYILKDLGRVYFQDGQFQQALNILKNSMDAGRPDSDGLFYLGRAQLELGMLDEALASLKRLVKKDGEYRQAYYFLGETCSKLGKTAESHYYLGIFYSKTGRFKNAQFHLNKASEGIDDIEKKKQIEIMLKSIQKVLRETR